MTVSTDMSTPAPTPWTAEEDAAFAALRRAVLRADGFTPLLAVCNEPLRRDRLIGRLADGIPDGTRLVRIRPDCRDVLAEVQRQAADPSGPPVMLIGLEAGLSDSSFDHPRVAVLNHRRDAWRDLARCAVVIWTPEYLLRPLARGAPDFLDWRSGTYFFVQPLMVEVRAEPQRYLGQLWRLTAPEREERIAHLRELIARYAQPPHGEDHAVELWQFELARHLQFSGAWDEAFELLQNEVLPRLQSRGDEIGTAITWGEIGDILFDRGELDEALRIRQQDELPVYERRGDVKERAVTLGKIADILHTRGELAEALRIRQQEELPVYERLADVWLRAMTLGKIADILHTRGDLDEALRITQEEELPVYERVGDVRSRAVALGRIAEILRRRGQLDEALRIRQEEQLPVYDRLGDVRERAVTLGNIALILSCQGNLDEALRIRRQDELPIYERLGDLPNELLSRAAIARMLMQRGRPEDVSAANEHLAWIRALAKKHPFARGRPIEQLLESIAEPNPLKAQPNPADRKHESPAAET